MNVLPIAPNFAWDNVVSPSVKEIVTVFVTEQLDALTKPPKKSIAWANIGSQFNRAAGASIVKVAVRLPDSLFYVDFDANRDGGSLNVIAPLVRVRPKMRNFRWPMLWNGGIGSYGPAGPNGEKTIEQFMGVAGLAPGLIGAAQAHKAYLAATLMMSSYTSSSQGVTATLKTYDQPGLVGGLPLWSNAANSGAHYAHPIDPNSDRFDNMYEAVGQFGPSALKRTMRNMYAVPHPCLPNLTLENRVTDIVGPLWMQDIFYETAIQTVNLQTAQVAGTGVAAATTNAVAAELLARLDSMTFIGASGIGPVRYWVSSLLNKHPYYWQNGAATANMTNGRDGGPSDMWVAISAEDGDAQKWCQFAGPTDFVPMIRLYGDGDPQAQKSREVLLTSDLDAGVGPGLPHCTAMYFEK